MFRKDFIGSSFFSRQLAVSSRQKKLPTAYCLLLTYLPTANFLVFQYNLILIAETSFLVFC